MLGPKKPGILLCGLWGYIGQKDNHSFNWDKFNHLGLDNDERGGDSVGRAVGDDIRKFVNKKKTQTTYKDYVINYKNGEPSHIAIGHTRKASIGAITEDNAQPIVIDIPEGGKFVMVHNGTIFNWEDLALKYGIVKTGKTDSMVLGEIIFQFGYDVLLEYNGGAAIIIRDDRFPDTLRVFRGQSLNFQKKLEEERPLSYYQESENSMWISSREDGLAFIGGDVDTIDEFEVNTLYTIHQGKIISTLKYDRSLCSAVRVYPATTPTTTNNHFSTKFNYYENEESYDDWYSKKYYTKKTYDIKKDYIAKAINLDQIVTSRLRYYFFDKFGEERYANGVVNLNEEGIRSMMAANAHYKPYYFYAGVMLKDKSAHSEVLKTFGKSKRFIDSDENILALCKYAAHPICTVDSDMPAYSNVRIWKTMKNLQTQKAESRACLFTGSYQMLFGKKIYKFESGEQTDIEFEVNIKKAVHIQERTPIALPAIYRPDNTIVKGFLPNTNREMVSKPSEPVTYIVGTEDLNDNDMPWDADPKPIDNAYAYSEDYLDDDSILEDMELNQYANKSLSDGLQAMLLAVDQTITDIEQTGLNGKAIAIMLSNLNKLQDVLLEDKKFKKYNLMIGHDEF